MVKLLFFDKNIPEAPPPPFIHRYGTSAKKTSCGPVPRSTYAFTEQNLVISPILRPVLSRDK